MKKLLCVLAVGLMANVAMASLGFDFGTVNPIEIPEGGTVDVLVLSNAGQFGRNVPVPGGAQWVPDYGRDGP